jgi:UDP-GlcNAc3NAcA epimerase
VIKASVLGRAIAGRWSVLRIDTGQHYDYELNGLLYQQLDVAPPDQFLEVGSADHAGQTAAVLTRCTEALREASPDMVVVIGDTNSTLGCALAAAKLRIPVVHVEAGLRSRDALMAEEINRRAVDAIAGLLCAPSESAAQRLCIEHPDATVVFTGDVSRDVLQSSLCKASLPPSPWQGKRLDGSPFVFATLHRAELTGDGEKLRAVINALSALSLPVIFPAHPRTAAVIERDRIRIDSKAIAIVAPVGYFESLALTRAASVVITDSGGVQREAYWSGTPCITLRGETEWTETVTAGANTLVDPSDAPRVLSSTVESVVNHRSASWNRDAYGDGTAAKKVADAIEAFLEASCAA